MWVSSVTLRKEDGGLGSEEGSATEAGGTVGGSSHIDKEPKTAGGKQVRNDDSGLQ